MKTNKLFLAASLVCLLATTSCTDLLDESYGKVVSENYQPQSELEISALVNAAYIPWRKTMLLWNGVVRTQELSADQDVIPARIGIGWIDGFIYKRWHEHTWTTNDDGMWQPWTRTYEGINNTNRIITQIEEGLIVLPSEEQKAALLAELHVLRASYYYILVDLFGNVPLVTDFRDASLPQQSTRAQVFDYIVNEINSNISLLSDEPRGYYYGRMNKWVAATLIAKRYHNGKVWSGEAMSQQCIAYCNRVMA